MPIKYSTLDVIYRKQTELKELTREIFLKKETEKKMERSYCNPNNATIPFDYIPDHKTISYFVLYKSQQEANGKYKGDKADLELEYIRIADYGYDKDLQAFYQRVFSVSYKFSPEIQYYLYSENYLEKEYFPLIKNIIRNGQQQKFINEDFGNKIYKVLNTNQDSNEKLAQIIEIAKTELVDIDSKPTKIVNFFKNFANKGISPEAIEKCKAFCKALSENDKTYFSEAKKVITSELEVKYEDERTGIELQPIRNNAITHNHS